MKIRFTLLVLLLSIGSFAQDTILHSSGEIEAVQILKLDKESNLIVYKSKNDTIYSSFKNIELFVVHSDLTEKNTNLIDNVVESGVSKGYIAPKSKRVYKNTYGTFSVSTNLTALIPFRYQANRITIEPEYRVNEFFSVKLPLSIGLASVMSSYQNYPGYFSQVYVDYSTPPELMYPPYFYQPENIIIQVGVNPKYYPFGKSNRFFAPYLGGAVNFGIVKDYGMDSFLEIDTASYTNNDVYWQTNARTTTITEGERNYFNFEGLIGMDFNFSNRITLTYEMGYSSQLLGEGNLNFRVYRKVGTGEPELIYDEPQDYTRGSHSKYKARLLLTYHF